MCMQYYDELFFFVWHIQESGSTISDRGLIIIVVSNFTHYTGVSNAQSQCPIQCLQSRS